MFMHTPARQAAWFKTTGAFPADNRFNTKLITLPQQKVLFNLVKSGSPYLENFIPPELDSKALLRAVSAPARRQHRCRQGGRGDGEDRAAHPADAAEADGELQDVVRVVQVEAQREPGAGGRVTSGTVALSRTRRTRRLRLGRVEPLVWIAPAIAVVVFVFGYSMVELVRTSLHFEGHWTTDNFRVAWTDPTFRTALSHNARLLIAVPILVATSLLLSILLFEGMRGWRFHRWALFLPYVLAIPVIGVVFGQLLQFNGLVNQLLRAVGLGRAGAGLARPAAMGSLDDDRRDRLAASSASASFSSSPGCSPSLRTSSRRAGMDGARFFRLHRRITCAPALGRDRLLRRGRGDHDGLLGLQLRLRDDERPGRPRRRDPGDGDATSTRGLPVPAARDRVGSAAPVRRYARPDRDLLPDPAPLRLGLDE